MPKDNLRPHSTNNLHIAPHMTHVAESPRFRISCVLCRDSLRGMSSVNLECCFVWVWPQRQTFVRILLQSRIARLLRADVRRDYRYRPVRIRASTNRVAVTTDRALVNLEVVLLLTNNVLTGDWGSLLPLCAARARLELAFGELRLRTRARLTNCGRAVLNIGFLPLPLCSGYTARSRAQHQPLTACSGYSTQPKRLADPLRLCMMHEHEQMRL